MTLTHTVPGSIDEVRIYNRSLSEDEIYRQYIRSKYTLTAPTATLGADEPYTPTKRRIQDQHFR